MAFFSFSDERKIEVLCGISHLMKYGSLKSQLKGPSHAIPLNHLAAASGLLTELVPCLHIFKEHALCSEFPGIQTVPTIYRLLLRLVRT